jgi:hypothetical protein
MEGFSMSAQILDFKVAKERRERERRKVSPERLAWVKQIAWGEYFWL